MKKTKIVLICFMLLLICIMPVINSNETLNEFEKNDLPFDVRLDIRITTKNNRTLPIHSHVGLLPSILFKYIDILSFSIYEDSENPEYLYATMQIRDFQFSEYRTCYALYWTYKGIEYYVGTNTHSLGDFISPVCGYFEDCYTDYQDYIIQGDIQEEENIISWIIPKEYIGNPSIGETLTDIHAASYLIYQKDCSALPRLRLASDRVAPIYGDGYTYTLQV